MKKNGNKVKIHTKDDLIDLMNKNLEKQKKISEYLQKEYDKVEKATDPEDRKIRNSLQAQLNAQFDAINRTCSSIIKINNSKLENDEEYYEEGKKTPKRKELVD